jgi:glutamate-1-semialdehyde aminotransferase/acyl carrier protein
MSALRDRLIDIAADLGGLERELVDPSAPLVELGFDSLVLTQLAQRLKREFAVELSFREFFVSLRTLDAVAERIGALGVSEDVLPASAGDAGERPALAASALTGGGSLADVLRQQLALLERQLDLIAGAAAPGAVAPSAAATPPAEARAARPAEPRAPAAAAAAAGPPMPRPQPGTEGLAPHHELELMRIAEAWNARTPGSKERTERDRPHFADPRTAAGFSTSWKEIVYPLVMARSEGALLWDVDGNRYVDLLNGFGPGFFGHSAPFIVDAVRAQLESGYEIGPQTPLAGNTARLICELTGLDRAAFVCTGSEAVMTALRLARTITGRDKIALFAGAYHGNFDEVLVRARPGERSRTLPAAPGIPRRAVDDVVVLEYGADASLDRVRALAGELAAVLVEPVQSRKPELQPRAFLHELRSITREAGIVLIFDEVVTGFRCHPGGAQAVFGIEADLATYGKVLGGGLPIGVVAGRRPFIDVLDGGPWRYGDDSMPMQGVTFSAGTFVRHPLAIAATHAALEYLRAAGPALQEQLGARTAELAARLGEIIRETGAPLQVPHFSSVMYFRATDTHSPFNALFYHFMREHGVYILEGFPSYLTLAHEASHVDEVVEAFRRSVARMQTAGFWPPAHPIEASGPVAVSAEPSLDTPPVPGARLGRDRDHSLGWFIENPDRPGEFIRVG